jgi:hypothetical protein
MSDEGAAGGSGFNEAPCSIDLRNPAGWLLHLRADNIAGLVDQLNDLWDGHAGKRTDLTNLTLFSFNPAIVADMVAGKTAEEAMGYEPDELATAAYQAFAQGATRQPTAASNGASGSKGAEKFKVGDPGHAEADLPPFFIDAITRRNTCPECDGDRFWDNRDNKKTGKEPDFRCGNQSCDAGKGYPWAVWAEESKSRSRSGARTR